MCQAALADLKMAIRAAGEHKQRIAVQVSIDGLRLRDEKTGVSCQIIYATEYQSIDLTLRLCSSLMLLPPLRRTACTTIRCIRYHLLLKT